MNEVQQGITQGQHAHAGAKEGRVALGERKAEWQDFSKSVNKVLGCV